MKVLENGLCSLQNEEEEEVVVVMVVFLVVSYELVCHATVPQYHYYMDGIFFSSVLCTHKNVRTYYTHKIHQNNFFHIFGAHAFKEKSHEKKKPNTKK